MSRVLVISDTQAPFHHAQTLEFLRYVYEEYKCDAVVHIGDEVDFHALGDYDTDPDGYSAGQELEVALEFMEDLYELFPEVKACVSNHTARPLRRAFSAGIPRAFLREYHEFLEAPSGWKWKDHWDINGVIYEHGESFGGQYAHLKHATQNMKPTVVGHHHSNAGIIYHANKEKLIWGMAVGCLVDTKAYAFKYGKKYPRKPILGCGVVVDGQPIFIPMLLNKTNKWVGKLVR